MHAFRTVHADASHIAVLVENRQKFALELGGPQDDKVMEILREQITRYFSEAMKTGECISVLAYHDDQLAGIGSMIVRQQPGNFKNPTGRWGYIMNMYTVPEFRRQGVCKLILNELVDAGNKIGITAFELHATPSGAPVYAQN